MRFDTLHRANEIKASLDALDKLGTIMLMDYPQVYTDKVEVNTASLDSETLEAWKQANMDFIDKQRAVLLEEFEKL